MKKFLLSLAVLFASTAIAQTQYKTVEMLTEIPEGEFLLAADPDGNQFLATDGENNLTTAPDDNALIIFESIGEQTGGYDLYAIKFAATGEYIEDLELGFYEGGPADSSDMMDYKKPYFTTTADIASAAKWTILPAATRYKAVKGDEGWEENWRTYTGQGTGTDTEESTGNMYPYEGAFVIMRDKIHDATQKDPVYLEVQGEYTMFAPWGNNDWYLFTYEEKTADDLLVEWWDTNFPDGPQALESAVGNRIGQYKEESVVALLEVYEAYTDWSVGNGGEAEELLAQSKAAYEALEVNQMVEGYYYIVSKRQNWAAFDNGTAMTGLRDYEVPVDEETGETTVTLESSKYIWYFSPVEGKKDTYLVKNYGTDRYVNTADYNDNTGIKTGEYEKAVAYTISYHSEHPGTVMVYNRDEEGALTSAWNIFSGNPAGDGNHIGNWYHASGNLELDEGNFFYLYGVAEELVDAIADEVVQFNRNAKLQELVETAKTDYKRGISYKAQGVEAAGEFTDHGLVKYTTDPETSENTINVTCNAPESTEGSILAMADDDYNTFFHSSWSDTSIPTPHHLVLDLGVETEFPAIAIKILKRNTTAWNANRAPTEWVVYGTNDDPYNEEVPATWTEEGKVILSYAYDYIKVTEGDEGNDTTTVANGIGYGGAELSGASYRYLRFDAVNNLNKEKNQFFSFAEFGVWVAAEDPEGSLNSAVPAAVLETFLNEMAKAEAELAAGKATEAQILALQAAYDEYLKNFPEPKRLTDALASAKSFAEGLPVESEPGEVGFYPESTLEAYNQAIAEVEATVAEVMSVETINAGIAKLDAAKAAILPTLNMFASGFYQIKVAGGSYEEALMHSSRTASDTKEVKGLRAEFAKQTGNVDEGLVDDENYINSVSSVWYLEVGENNQVAIRSLGNGLYLQPVLSMENNSVQMTEDKAWLEVQADGLKNGGCYNFIVGTDTATATKGRHLYANINSTTASQTGNLVAWTSAGGNDNSTMKIEEVDLANFGFGVNTFVLGTNKTQFFTLPYDAYIFSQDAAVCEVEGFYTDEETGEMAIYFKKLEDESKLNAGQAYLVQTNDDVDFLNVELEEEAITGFENFNYSYEPKEVNGLQATVFSKKVKSGFGILKGANRIVATETTEEKGEEVLVTIAPLAGYINTTNMPTLDAAPEGDEYVKIVSLAGKDVLNSIEGVEVAPAAKTGVYTISGVRLNSAKNLPAGIYVINGKKVVK